MQGTLLFSRSETSKGKTGSLGGAVSAHRWTLAGAVNALGAEKWLTGWWAGVIQRLCQLQLHLTFLSISELSGPFILLINAFFA